jgi:hypothetical protein
MHLPEDTDMFLRNDTIRTCAAFSAVGRPTRALVRAAIQERGPSTIHNVLNMVTASTGETDLEHGIMLLVQQAWASGYQAAVTRYNNRSGRIEELLPNSENETPCHKCHRNMTADTPSARVAMCEHWCHVECMREHSLSANVCPDRGCTKTLDGRSDEIIESSSSSSSETREDKLATLLTMLANTTTSPE